MEKVAVLTSARQAAGAAIEANQRRHVATGNTRKAPALAGRVRCVIGVSLRVSVRAMDETRRYQNDRGPGRPFPTRYGGRRGPRGAPDSPGSSPRGRAR